MIAEVKSKRELQTMAGKLKNTSSQLASEAIDIIGHLSRVENYDGINISQAAMAIQNNLKNLSGEMESLASSVNNYSADINDLDTYDIHTDEQTQINPTQTSANASDNNNNSNFPRTEAYPLGNDNPNSNTSDINEQVNNRPKELKAEGQVGITQGDPNYDLNDRNHQYVESIFQMTSGNLSYEISNQDYDLLCAIVSAESDKSYDGSLAVASTILNRCEQPDYIAAYGADPIAQATAYNQFIGYRNNDYKQYINGRYPEPVMQAVTDALAGVRNHKICNFSKNNMITL